MATNQPNPTSGENATAQAKAALEEFRRRAASRPGGFGRPGITLGPFPSSGGTFGPGVPPFPFPGQPSAPGDPVQTTVVGTSVFHSLGTLLRLSVDLLNSGLEGFLAGAGSRSAGGGSCGCGCGCGCEESCCGAYAAPQGCGCGCGCGCNPSVRNCP